MNKFLYLCCYKSHFNLCYVYRVIISWNVTHFVVSLKFSFSSGIFYFTDFVPLTSEISMFV